MLAKDIESGGQRCPSVPCMCSVTIISARTTRDVHDKKESGPDPLPGYRGVRDGF